MRAANDRPYGGIATLSLCISLCERKCSILDYPIFYQGAEIGRVTVDPDGLYYRLTASAAEPGRGVWRLWACVGEESRLIGVLFPETGGLRLEKRISRRAWPILPDGFVLGREREGFRPWRGVFEGQEVSDAMLRRSADDARTLAVFAPPEGPVPLAEYVTQMREAEIDGRPCLLPDLPQTP